MNSFIPASRHDLFEMMNRRTAGPATYNAPGSCSSISLAIRIRGRFDEKRLETAIARTAQALPVLGSRFSAERKGWERLAAPVFLTITDRPPEDFYTRSFDTSAHPPIRAVLSRQENDTLILSIDHGVSDAHGSVQAVLFIAFMYRMLRRHPDYYPAQIELPADRSYDEILSEFSDEELRGLACEEIEKSRAGQRYAELFAAEPSCGSDRLFVSRISPDRFDAIHAYAHAHGATINDLLLAADCLALTEFARERGVMLATVPVRIAVDLRYRLGTGSPSREKLMRAGAALFPNHFLPAYLRRNRACMNYSVPISLPVPLTRAGGGTLAEILADVITATRALKHSARGVGEAALIEQTFDGIPSAFDASQMFSAPFVSNAGVLNAAWFRFGRDAVIDEIFPFAYFNGGYQFSLGAVTWKNSIILSTIADAESVLCPRMLNRLTEILEGL